MSSPTGDRNPISHGSGFGRNGSPAVPGGSSAETRHGSDLSVPGKNSVIHQAPMAKASDTSPMPSGAPGAGETYAPAPTSRDTAPAPTPASPAAPPMKEPMKEPVRESVKDSAPAPGAAAKETVVKDSAPAVQDTVSPAKDPVPAPKDSVPAPAAKDSAPAASAPAPPAKDSAPAPAAKDQAPAAAVPAPAKATPPSAPRQRPASSPASASTAAAAAKSATEPEPAPVPKSKLGRTRGTTGAVPPPRVRRARLKIANIDPWSVMKVSFLFSVALGVILLVAVTLLWALLDFMGFFSTVAGTIDDITGKNGGGGGGFDVVAFFSLPRVLGMATILALIDIILITALTTLAAYLYNLSTDLVGGVEVTLAEEE